jgi:superfamily I DNA/RNA helicase
VGGLAQRWGSVGVIVPPVHTDDVAGALDRASVPYGTGARGGLGGVVTLLLPPEAKGLEFDAVVVVEPSEVYEDQRGGRLLYIALTRAVQELAVVHARPLPAALAG